uniref:Uncharacterized protein n=1 Tax=Coccidioides posadasii RMSCC 3488 TaxID=454284 RepID=A0A0J6FBN9_COCPO|nr:hypothetical protein CPAG_02999 [Coccidioides posadasii RMSCC 3488]
MLTVAASSSSSSSSSSSNHFPPGTPRPPACIPRRSRDLDAGRDRFVPPALQPPPRRRRPPLLQRAPIANSGQFPHFSDPWRIAYGEHRRQRAATSSTHSGNYLFLATPALKEVLHTHPWELGCLETTWFSGKVQQQYVNAPKSVVSLALRLIPTQTPYDACFLVDISWLPLNPSDPEPFRPYLPAPRSRLRTKERPLT